MHAVLPALANKDLAPDALPILDRAATTLAAENTEEPATSLLLMLARSHFDHGQTADGRQRLKDLLSIKTRGANNDQQSREKIIGRSIT